MASRAVEETYASRPETFFALTRLSGSLLGKDDLPMDTEGRAVCGEIANCLTSTDELAELVKGLIPRDSFTGRDLRSSGRHPYVEEVTALQIDEQLHPVGAEFEAVTRNISSSGLCLIAPLMVRTPYLIVQISAAAEGPKRLLIKVRRCRPFRGYFEIGGTFVTNP